MRFLLSERLLQISRSYNDLIMAELPESDIRRDIDVAILAILHSNQHQMTQKEIAGLLNIDASRVSDLIFALVQKGYVTTARNAADRRRHFVSLTAKGIALIPAIQMAIESVNTMINHHLDDHSLFVFYNVLRQIEANLLTKTFPARWSQACRDTIRYAADLPPFKKEVATWYDKFAHLLPIPNSDVDGWYVIGASLGSKPQPVTVIASNDAQFHIGLQFNLLF